MGVLASIVGVFVGLALAKGLFKLFDAVGFTLPNNGLVVETRTIVVALLVGIIVTLLASLRPALRATRVPPIAAVREGATLPVGPLPPLPRRRRGPSRDRSGSLRCLRALRRRPRHDQDPALDGTRRAADLHRRRARSSRSSPPLAGVLGWPATQLGGVAGALARDNSQPQPAAHRLDGVGADDRPRAGDARRRARRRHHASFRGAVNDSGPRTTRSPRRTTSRRSRSRPRTRGEDARCDGRRERARRRRPGVRQTIGTATGVNPAGGRVFNVDWVEGSQSVFASSARHGAFVDKRLAKNPTCRSARRSSC